MHRRIRRASIALLLLIFGCLFCDVATRIWVAAHPVPGYLDMLLAPSPAYADAPYWSDDFAAELRKWPIGCFFDKAESYHSRYFNSEQCQRKVIGQPDHAEYTIWLFGNSTLYSGELPDAYTIASQIQALLPNWRVENSTTAGATVGMMLDLLKQEPTRSGDVVVFYSGVADAMGLYGAAHFGRPMELGEIPCKVLNGARDKLYTFRALCDWQLSYIPDSALSLDFLAPYATQVEQDYSSALSEARRYAQGHGLKLINVLQPYLWSRPLTPAELAAATFASTERPRIGEVLPIAWPHLQLYADLDLTHVLDEVRNTQVVFFDGWHLNSVASKIIARAIAAAVR